MTAMALPLRSPAATASQVDGLGEPTVVTMGFGLAEEMQDAWIVDVSGALRIDGAPCGPAWFSVEAGCREERGSLGLVAVRPTTEVQDLACHTAPIGDSKHTAPIGDSKDVAVPEPR
jgi:hypothetical protein